MSTEYPWDTIMRRRLSRRRLLAAGLAVGAASVAAACGGGEEARPPAPTPSPAGGRQLVPVKTRGGVYRAFSYDAMPLDTYDPHQTQFGPLYNMHSAVFSKVLKYTDVYKGVIEPDLATAMPEIVDERTYVIKLRPGVTFHDTPAIRAAFPAAAGRELTAEDVKYSIERQVNPQSPKSALYYRASQWQTVDRIELVEPLTLRITTKAPTATFIHFLADTNAFIVPREVVDANDEMNSLERMVGSGPFLLDNLVSLQYVRLRRNPLWFARNDLADQGLPDRPFIDTYEALWPPQDDTASEAALRSKQVDYTSEFIDQTNVERLARELGLEVDATADTGWINSRLLIDHSPAAQTPLRDVRLRRAIHLAIDRTRFGQQMFQRWFYLVGPVPAAVERWALPLAELTKKPGYRFSTREREEDVAEAKRLWDAAGGPAVGPITVTYAGSPIWLKEAFPQFQEMLRETLRLEVEGDIDLTGYTKLAQGTLEKRLIFTLNYDNGWNDLDDWLYPYFHSQGSKNSFNVSDPTLDAMLDDQRAEFDYERRHQIGLDIQHYLLDNVLARLDWVAQVSMAPAWPYLKNHFLQPWFGYLYHFLPNIWLDTTDPSFAGRPA